MLFSWNVEPPSLQCLCNLSVWNELKSNDALSMYVVICVGMCFLFFSIKYFCFSLLYVKENLFIKIIFRISLCGCYFLFCFQWLFVAQTDSIETSACIISPPQVKYDLFYLFVFNILELFSTLTTFSFNPCSFLLNGKGVDRRTNVHVVCAVPFTIWITLFV